MTNEITNSQDIIDIRDVIERVEELETQLPPSDESDGTDNEDRAELATLTALLDECKGNGGDHQYKGDWYPVTLIADDYFEDYAQDFASDCCEMPREISWPFTCIDWEQAAKELQIDYTSVDFDGATYWVR